MDRQVIWWHLNGFAMAMGLALSTCVGTALGMGHLYEPNNIVRWFEVCMCWMVSVVFIIRAYRATE